MPETRLRFAPSPTGYLHLGSARVALFNWMYARHVGGKFLLRIEDTDPERSKPELIDLIFRTLEWLGIDWDEEPIFQSQRQAIYKTATTKLLAEGNAYRCSCTQEEVKVRTADNAIPGYDGFCRERNLGPGEAEVVRFATPREGVTEFSDLVYGDVSFENANLEDFVIQRSDGSATFFIPNAVDDVEQQVSHIVRGQDLINITPKVLLLRHALGYKEDPTFAHMPLIVNEQRKKLSKRRDDVAVEDFKAKGILAEAMRNCIALLGWGPREGEEIQPIESMIKQFELKDVNASSAFFDSSKLEHINGEYIRQMSVAEFVTAAQPFLEDAPWDASKFDAGVFERMAPLLQERVRTLVEVAPMIEFLFVDSVEYDDAAWQKVMVKGIEIAKAMLPAVIELFADVEWTATELHDKTMEIAEKNDLKLGKAQAPIRLAITGKSVGPPLFESLEVLGRQESIARLNAALAKL